MGSSWFKVIAVLGTFGMAVAGITVAGTVTFVIGSFVVVIFVVCVLTSIVADFDRKHGCQRDRIHNTLRLVLGMVRHKLENKTVSCAVGESTKRRKEEVGIPGKTIVDTLSALETKNIVIIVGVTWTFPILLFIEQSKVIEYELLHILNGVAVYISVRV